VVQHGAVALGGGGQLVGQAADHAEPPGLDPLDHSSSKARVTEGSPLTTGEIETRFIALDATSEEYASVWGG
jgi:hypothetical protein